MERMQRLFGFQDLICGSEKGDITASYHPVV